MDMAKRSMQRQQPKKLSTRGKRKADTSPPSTREKRVLRPHPAATTAIPSPTVEPVIRVEPPATKAIPTARPARSEPANPVGPASRAATPVRPAPPGPCTTSNNLVIIFSTEPDILALYSPMSWDEMVPSGGVAPSLNQVHVNLVEDGLDVERDEYTLYDPEGAPVRSDRCLNYLLGRCLKQGVAEAEWKVVIDGRFIVFAVLCWRGLTRW